MVPVTGVRLEICEILVRIHTGWTGDAGVRGVICGLCLMKQFSKRFSFSMVSLAVVAAGLALPQISSDSKAPWWKNAVIYEIYPRSFADTNGDGTGDLNGITAHLEYLKDLGVDGIWVTPFFTSPQADFGYDISDYTGIDPQYGTLADFDRLVAEAKSGISASCWILSSITLPTSTPGLWNRVHRVRTPKPTGTCGVTRAQTGKRPPTGFPFLVVRPGSSILRAISSTITLFISNNRTSTRAIAMSVRRCTTSCGSG